MIGVICLDTSFTKIPGHIRNPATFDFPVRYEVVSGATAERVVTRPDPELLGPFVAAARSLVASGARAVTSGCGFLALHQRELADAVDVPVFASSLVQLPLVHRMLRRDQRVGLLVARKGSLTPRHLSGVGAGHVPVRVVGMEDQPEFREVVLEARRDELDASRLGREVLARASRLVSENPDIGALVIECTDLAPYSHLVQQKLRMPVFDIVTLTEMVHRTLAHRPYGPP
ncbi:aspartate/glutamate racemase family protein [Actinocorallia aurantiaca]|uniref:Aspartate/glutamate racemase family protein n=1 Tax=Actinocorallia aurantiaca TaxID=46204 RepID=A0ABN3TY81_9ACTN